MYYKPTPSAADPTPVNLLPNQAAAGQPLLLDQQPRLHGGIRAVTPPLPEAVASPAAASDAARPAAGCAGRWPSCGPPARGSGRRTCWCSRPRWRARRWAAVTGWATRWSRRPRSASRRSRCTWSTTSSTPTGTGGIRSSGAAPIAAGELPKSHALAVAALVHRRPPWPPACAIREPLLAVHGRRVRRLVAAVQPGAQAHARDRAGFVASGFVLRALGGAARPGCRRPAGSCSSAASVRCWWPRQAVHRDGRARPDAVRHRPVDALVPAGCLRLGQRIAAVAMITAYLLWALGEPGPEPGLAPGQRAATGGGRWSVSTSSPRRPPPGRSRICWRGTRRWSCWNWSGCSCSWPAYGSSVCDEPEPGARPTRILLLGGTSEIGLAILAALGARRRPRCCWPAATRPRSRRPGKALPLRDTHLPLRRHRDRHPTRSSFETSSPAAQWTGDLGRRGADPPAGAGPGSAAAAG